MAVKKHGLDPENNLPSDLGTLLALLQDISKEYMSNSQLFQYCKSIITLLSKVPVPKDAAEQEMFYSQVHQAEDFLKKTVIETEPNSKINWLYGLLEHLYLIISNALPDTSPAVSIVLSLLDSSMRNVAVSIFIRQGGSVTTVDDDNQTNAVLDIDSHLCNALSTLCHWLCYWTGTPSLNEWIISFMTELEVANKYEILLEVSTRAICDLFDALQNPLVRTVVINVVLHILASTRDSLDTFDKISYQVPIVLENLAGDTSPESRSVLQNLVEAFTALFDLHPEQKETYTEIMYCLDSHIKSNKGQIMELPVWKKRGEENSDKKTNSKVGLVNLGNTCYMNSALQALFMTKLFSNGIVMSNMKFPLIFKLKTLFAHMMFSDMHCVFPHEIYMYAKPGTFRRGAEQDTSEFICHLLDRLHNSEIQELYIKTAQGLARAIANESDENDANCSSSSSGSNYNKLFNGKRKRTLLDAQELKRQCTRLEEAGNTRDPLNPPTLVQKVFAGLMKTSIRCTNCNYVSSKNDAFWDLQLSFPETEESADYSVQQLVEYYFSPEKLFGDNRYHCQVCKTLQDAERSASIENSPKNLIIVLKQFYYNPKLFLRAKLFHKVELNNHITVVERNATKNYELYAVIVHSGSTLDNGHYYTVAKESQHWYVFDDSNVKPCTVDMAYGQSTKCTPYILFYKRTNDDNSQKNAESSNKTESSNDADENLSDKVFNPEEENVPFSFLPTYLARKVKGKMHSQRLKRGVSKYRPTNISGGSSAAGHCTDLDKDQPGSSRMS